MPKRQTPWMKAYDAARVPLETELKNIRTAITKKGHITHKQHMLRLKLRARVRALYELRFAARENARADELNRAAEDAKVEMDMGRGPDAEAETPTAVRA